MYSTIYIYCSTALLRVAVRLHSTQLNLITVPLPIFLLLKIRPELFLLLLFCQHFVKTLKWAGQNYFGFCPCKFCLPADDSTVQFKIWHLISPYCPPTWTALTGENIKRGRSFWLIQTNIKRVRNSEYRGFWWEWWMGGADTRQKADTVPALEGATIYCDTWFPKINITGFRFQVVQPCLNAHT